MEPDHNKYSTHHLKQPWPEDDRHPYNPWSQITTNTPHTISSSHDQKMKDIPTTQGARSQQILHTPSQVAMTRRWKTSLQPKESDHIKYSTHHLKQPWPEDERHPYNPWSQITSNTPHTISGSHDQKMKDIPTTRQITSNTPHTISSVAMTRRWKTSLQPKEPDHNKYSTHHLKRPWPEDERHPYNPRSQITTNTPHTISSGYDQKMKDIPTTHGARHPYNPRSQITSNTPHTISGSHDQKMKDIPTTHGARSHQILHTPSQAAMTRRWKTSLQPKEPDHIKYSTHHLR